MSIEENNGDVNQNSNYQNDKVSKCNQNIKVELNNKMYIQLLNNKLSFDGSLELLHLMGELKNKWGYQIDKWPLNDVFEFLNNSREELLIKQFLLKLNHQYNLPYKDEEICHCRQIKTDKVVCSIIDGAQTVSEVTRRTEAGAQCGSCKADSQEIIKYLIKVN